MLAKYAARGLRLIEVEKGDLIDLPDIAERVEGRPERFIVFCDDLTFDAGESGYRALKVMLDGSIAGGATNVLIYATSNRRHMLPEYFSENLETRHIGEEVHPGESVEEKISLSERFGLWISFYPFGQDDYLAAVAGWLAHFGVKAPASAATRRRMQEACNGRSRADPAAAAWRGDSPEYAGEHARRRPNVDWPRCHVAAAVLYARMVRSSRAARRQALCSCWEFPGGKLGPGKRRAKP